MVIKRFLVIISIISSLFLFVNFTKDDRLNNIQNLNFEMGVKSIIGNKSNISEEVLFVINIPKIDLKNVVYALDSNLNYVDYNIQILEGSDINNNFLFLAGHSGGGDASYFDRLIELDVGDIILIDKGGEEISFVVETYFYIPKNGYLEYFEEKESGVLYLITCSLEYLDWQLVVKATLID